MLRLKSSFFCYFLFIMIKEGNNPIQIVLSLLIDLGLTDALLARFNQPICIIKSDGESKEAVADWYKTPFNPEEWVLKELAMDYYLLTKPSLTTPFFLRASDRADYEYKESMVRYGFVRKKHESLLEWIQIVTNYNPDAIKKANELAQTYQVNVTVIKGDKEYESDAMLEKSISQKMYFISNDSWQQTAYATEYLIRYEKMRVKILSDLANAKRTEKASETSTRLSEKIEEIKKTYREAHEGKEPSLGQLADILTAQQIESPNGLTKWYAQTVKRVLERSQVQR